MSKYEAFGQLGQAEPASGSWNTSSELSACVCADDRGAAYRAVVPSSGCNVIPRRARPGLAGLRPPTLGVMAAKGVSNPHKHRGGERRQLSLPELSQLSSAGVCAGGRGGEPSKACARRGTWLPRTVEASCRVSPSGPLRPTASGGGARCPLFRSPAALWLTAEQPQPRRHLALRQSGAALARFRRLRMGLGLSEQGTPRNVSKTLAPEMAQARAIIWPGLPCVCRVRLPVFAACEWGWG